MQDIYTVYLIESKCVSLVVSQSLFYVLNSGGCSREYYDIGFTCRVIDPEMPGYGEPATCLWRRYSEFELLRNYLEVMYPAIIIPPLPEKRVSVLIF